MTEDVVSVRSLMHVAQSLPIALHALANSIAWLPLFGFADVLAKGCTRLMARVQLIVPMVSMNTYSVFVLHKTI